MKKLITALTIMGALVANATLLIYEPFDYVANPTNTLNGYTPSIGNQWYGTPSGGTRNGFIASGSLSAPSGLQASTGNRLQVNNGGIANATNYFSSMQPMTGGQTYYFSYLLSVTSNKWAAGAVQPLGGFLWSTGFGANTFGTSLGIVCPSSTTNESSYFQFALTAKSGATYAVTNSTQHLFGTDVYMIVGSYTVVAGSGNDLMKIWINPDSSSFGGTEPAATIQQTWTGTEQEGATGTNGFAAYKINASSLNAGFNLDELRVGTTWASVTPAAISAQPPVITSVLSATGTVNQVFSYQITADNTPVSFDATGLPADLNVDTNSGAISGTPTVAGSNDVTISASNAGGTDSRTLAIIISPAPVSAPVITSALLATGTVNQAFSYQITADNSPVSFDATGLPTGLSVNTNSGAITGTPTVEGSNNVTISASNSGGTDSKTLTVVINPVSVDSNGNGIPDSWEQQYYGTNSVNPSALSANGINTILEAYVAGLNPTNSFAQLSLSIQPLTAQMLFQWQAVSGRVYSVYWTTNLLNGFQPLETNIVWPQNSWTDTVHGVQGGGFYRIDVRMAQ